MDPWLYLILAPVLAASITQVGKWLVELSGVNVSAIAAQIGAWIISTGLAFLAQAHLPASLGLILQAAQPLIVGVVTTALSFAAHDLAAALQAIMAWLQSLVPPQHSAGKV